MSEKNTHALDALLHAVAPVPLPEVRKLIIDAKQEIISEFLEDINYAYKELFGHYNYRPEIIFIELIKKWEEKL